VTSKRAVLIFGLLCSILIAICAISSDSLWIDEFGTWFLTRADSVPEWWERFQSWPDSDALIPLYHFYMYLWTKLFGTGTVAMRASNVGMFVIANVALLWPFRSRPNIAFPLTLTSCLSSPIWYYLNELRPYIMLYMGTCLMIGAAIEVIGSEEKPNSFAIKVLAAGAVLSSGATVVGIVWAGSIILFILAYWLLIRKESLTGLVEKNYATLAIATVCVVALLLHDVRMFALGKIPAPHESNLLTLLFSLYTNVGLLGVGPGMLDIRANGVGALIPFGPIIALSGLLVGLLAIGGLVEMTKALGFRTIVILNACVLLPVLFTVALGLALHWRVLPRHLIPLISLFSVLYALGFAWWWRRGAVDKAIVLIFLIVMAYSSLSVRLAPRHAKDDYKHAAELATAEIANDGNVWWVADFRGALYYGVPYVSDEFVWPQARYERGVKFFMGQKSLSFLSAQERPTLVLMSKPDTYDRWQNVVTNYLSTNGYHVVASFPAFSAWRQ
jgi:hypothetical protein